MNKIYLLGNVGKDSETNGAWLNFSLATSKKIKASQTDWRTDTQWHRCKMYGERAQKLAQYVLKGTKLLVEGEVQYSEYTKKDGTKGYSTDNFVHNIEFAGRPAGEQKAASDAPQFDNEEELPF